MSIDRSKIIKITHVINPHLFWFKYVDTPDTGAKQIELALINYVAESGDRMSAAKSNGRYRNESYVAVFMASMEKYIRAEIDVCDDPLLAEHEIIVWAIDYGIPLKTSLDSIVLLNAELKSLCRTTKSAIIRGGIAEVLPATNRYNVDNECKMVRLNKWELRAIEVMQQLLETACVEISFTKTFEIENHPFGILELNLMAQNQIRSFGEILVCEIKRAEVSKGDYFKRDISKLETFQINRWLNNDKEISVKTDNRCEELKPINQVFEPKPLIKTVKRSSSAPIKVDKCTVDHSHSLIDQNKIVREFTNRIKTGERAEERSQTQKPSSIETPKTKPVNKVPCEAATTSIVQNASLAKVASSDRPLQMGNTTIAGFQNVGEKNILINNLKQIRILTRNNFEEPTCFNAANFTPAIFKGMKYLGMEETYISQAYAWPNLLRGNSLVLIDSQNRGKTVAYLPALCSLIERALERNGKNVKGTTAIIVCLTASVPRIAGLCRNILRMRQFMANVVEAIGTRDVISVTVKLFNGCNILVTTAPCLKELIGMQNSSHVIKSDKLQYIAFENIDSIMEKHTDSCNEIFKELCLRKSYKGELRQFIVTSRTWKPFLQSFLNEKIADSVLVIGNYLEASLWACVTLQLIFCRTKVKLQHLTDQIKEIPIAKERTLVICNELEEAEEVAKHLESNDVPVELVKNICSDYGKSKVKSFWTKMEGVLICDDEQLKTTGIMDAHHIFHYTVPREDFCSFLYRLSAMLNNYGSSFESNANSTNKKLTSTVIISDDNQRQLPKFIDLLIRDGQTVPENYLKECEKARKAITDDRARHQCYEQICSFVFMHGTKDHFTDCPHRHVLLQSDILTENQITHGTLRFYVLKIISPTEYIVRPTELKSEGGQWNVVNGSDEFIYVDTQMQAFYKNEKNVKCLAALKLGEKCVIEHHEKFYRGEIIRINPRRQPTDGESCLVRFVDTGDTQQYEAHEMYSLNESFGSLPNQAFTLHLTGVIPADKEDDWDPSISNQVKKELNKWTETQSHTIYEANVLFALRNTLVVNVMRLINLSRGVVHCSLKTYLKNRNYGEISPENSQKVIDMAKNAGVKVIETKKTDAKKTEENSCEASTTTQLSDTQVLQNASYDSNESTYEEENNEKWACPWKAQHENVEITTFHNPHDFYIAQKSELTRKLYHLIDEYAKANIETAKDQSINTPDVDMPVLARVENRYYRGKVIDVNFGTQCDLKVFLVDTGEVVDVESTSVFEIPDNLVEMCPYQAIWCNLIGIKPIGDETQWTEQQNDSIYNKIDLEYGNNLYLHTITVNKCVTSPANILRYDIVLLAVRDHEQTCLNDKLESLKLAEYDPSTKHHLQNLPSLLEDDVSDSSDSDWEKEIDVKGKNEFSSSSGQRELEASDRDDLDLEDAYVHFTEEDVLELFPDFVQKKPQSTPMPTPTTTLPKIDELNEVEAEIKSTKDNDLSLEEMLKQADNGYVSAETDGTDASSEHYEVNHQVEYIYKRPKVYWWQTEQTLILRIGAHDDVQYGLEITPDYLKYATKDCNNEAVMAVINFFGSIECENVVHEIRGLNVIVRLRKSCAMMWPRLLHAADKCSWIIQNMEAFRDEKDIDYDEHNSDQIDQDQSDDSDDEIERCGPLRHYESSDDDLISEEA